MSSLPFPWIYQLPNAQFATCLRSFSMRHVIFIRHVPSFSLFCTIPDLAGVGPGAENRDIPCTYCPDAHQQDLVLRQKRWWRDPPWVFWGWNAFVVDHCPCVDCCKFSHWLPLSSSQILSPDWKQPRWMDYRRTRCRCLLAKRIWTKKYLAHVKHLKDFDEKTKESNIIPRLRKHLLKMARYVTTMCEWSPDLLAFTGSMPKSTPRVSSPNRQNSRKKISRRPRRNGRVLFSLKARTRCKVVSGLFYAINSINYPTYVCIPCVKYHTL